MALPIPAMVGDARSTLAVHATALSYPCKQRSTAAAGATPSRMRPQPGSLSVAFRAHTAEEPEIALPCKRSRALMPAASKGLYPEAHRCCTLQAPSTTWQPPSHKRTAADSHHVQQQRHKLHCPACGASNAPRRQRQQQWAAASKGNIQRHIAAALRKLRQRHGSHRRTSAPLLTAIMYSSRDTSCIVPRAVPAMPRGDGDSDCGRQERGTR